MIGRYIEFDGGRTVSIEEGLKGEGPSEWRSVTFVIPDPEGPMPDNVWMVDVVKIGETYRIALGYQSGLKIRSSENDLVGGSQQGQQIED